jgi:pSer/pThr/pTyr-binding forkhead associated (FHA) protein
VLRTWIIGSDNQCDLVVDHPAVSRRHCQLTQTDRGFFLEDLDSRNGTYLNGQRITARIAVGHCDAVQLGQHVPMPWPPEVPVSRIRLIRIGAGPDNDIVFDLPMVSWRHAVIRVEQGYAMLEDAGSTNGTGIGDRSNRIAEPTRLKKGDVVFFGSHQVTAEELIDRAREILKRM